MSGPRVPGDVVVLRPTGRGEVLRLARPRAGGMVWRHVRFTDHRFVWTGSHSFRESRARAYAERVGVPLLDRGEADRFGVWAGGDATPWLLRVEVRR